MSFDIIQSEKHKEKRKSEENLCELWDTIKGNNLTLLVSGEEREEGGESIFKEIMA